MRRNTDQSTVGFHARVPAHEKDALQALLPMKGGMTWWAETVVTKFLAVVESDPILQKVIHDRILDARITEPPRGLADLMPRISTDLYKRFNRIFPQKGATTWFMREALSAYITEASEIPSLESQLEVIVNNMLADVALTGKGSSGE